MPKSLLCPTPSSAIAKKKKKKKKKSSGDETAAARPSTAAAAAASTSAAAASSSADDGLDDIFGGLGAAKRAAKARDRVITAQVGVLDEGVWQ